MAEQDFKYPSVSRVKSDLANKLEQFLHGGVKIDSITFAGNGEPTLHPQFARIVETTVELRDQFYPKTKIAILSNATRLRIPEIKEAIRLADVHMLKLDAGREETFQKINQPPKGITLQQIIEDLKDFPSGLVIQSLFVKGWSGEEYIDNTQSEEILAWLDILKQLNLELVIIYSIEREPAEIRLEKIPREILERIAIQVEKAGIKAEVY